MRYHRTNIQNFTPSAWTQISLAASKGTITYFGSKFSDATVDFNNDDGCCHFSTGLGVYLLKVYLYAETVDMTNINTNLFLKLLYNGTELTRQSNWQDQGGGSCTLIMPFTKSSPASTSHYMGIQYYLKKAYIQKASFDFRLIYFPT